MVEHAAHNTEVGCSIQPGGLWCTRWRTQYVIFCTFPRFQKFFNYCSVRNDGLSPSFPVYFHNYKKILTTQLKWWTLTAVHEVKAFFYWSVLCNWKWRTTTAMHIDKSFFMQRSIFQVKWAMLLKMTDLDCNAQRRSNSYAKPIFSVEVCNTVKNDGLWLQHTETSDFFRKWFFFHSLCATLLKMTD